MNKLLIFAFALFFFLACGDSPFLNSEPSPTEGTENFELQEALSLPKSRIKIKTFWRTQPEVMNEGRLLILLFQEKGRPYAKTLDLKVKLWMPSMNHGSMPVTIEKVSNGVYEAREIFFTMPGEWDIHFQHHKDGELFEEVKWGLRL